MNVVAAFLLDANVFIEAAQRYYAFDLAPRFWTNLEQLSRDARLGSIDRVRKELEKGGDRLAQWATREFAHAFSPSDDAQTIARYGEVMTWVATQPQFMAAAKEEFARGADGWLIAYARAHGRVVVTHEQLSPDARRKVPIPNVCAAFGVQYLNTFAMLRELGVTVS